MTVSSKKIQIIISIFLVLTMLGSQIVFASEKGLQEVVMQIDGESEQKPIEIEFNEPGTQIITIENHFSKEIEVGYLYYIGSEFTTPLAIKSISLNGRFGSSNIPANTSSSFEIRAAEDASASVNQDGELFLLNYRIKGESKDQFAKVCVQIKYHDKLKFSKRNLLVSPGDSEAILTLDNKYDHPINLTKVDLGVGDDSVGVNFDNCSSINSGKKCKIKIPIYDTAFESKPVYVRYKIGDDESEILAVAAVHVKKSYGLEKSNAESVQDDSRFLNKFMLGVAGASCAAFDGFLIAEVIRLALLKEYDFKLMESQNFRYILAGQGFSVASIGNLIDYNSNGNSNLNTFSFALAFNLRLGEMVCKFKPRTQENSFACRSAVLACGLAGTFGEKLLSASVFSNYADELPEQYFLRRQEQKGVGKMTHGFGSSASIRFLCKGAINMFADGVPKTFIAATDSFVGDTIASNSIGDLYYDPVSAVSLFYGLGGKIKSSADKVKGFFYPSAYESPRFNHSALLGNTIFSEQSESQAPGQCFDSDMAGALSEDDNCGSSCVCKWLSDEQSLDEQPHDEL